MRGLDNFKTVTKKNKTKLEATEMWFLQRMLRISWTAKKSNETELREANTTRSLTNRIRKRQATFFVHVMRREKLEHVVTTGKIEGKCSRGKHREKMLEGLTNWLQEGRVTEALKATRDREE